MKNWTAPTDEDVDRLVAKLTDIAQLRYFFDHLQNPLWIAPLTQRGFFRNPPEPVTDEGGAERHPVWPQIFYLERMATDARFSAQIGKVLEGIIATENVSIISKVLDTALKLHPDDVKPLASTIKGWVGRRRESYLHKDIGDLATRLLEAGHSDAGFSLAKALLAVRSPNRIPGDEDAFALRRPDTDVEPYWYDHVLATMTPSLARHVGMPALDLILGHLSRVIEIQRPGARPPRDGSHIWRTAIEVEEDRGSDRIENSLVTAARDLAVALVRNGSVPLHQVLAKLESGKWNIHKRLGWHVLRIFAKQAPEQVTRRLLDKIAFDDDDFRHEYYMLVKETYPQLSSEEQTQVVRLILEGPYHMDEWVRYFEKRFDRSPTPEERNEYRDEYRRDRLEPIVDHLDDESKQRYAGWIQAYGSPVHHAATFVLSGGFGPVSPLKPEEIAEKSDDDLLRYLRSYQHTDEMPIEGWEDIGLARALEAAVDQTPARFLGRRSEYVRLRPRFVEAVIQGLDRAAKRGEAIDWAEAIGLAEEAIRSGALSVDDRSAGMAVSNLLTTAFRPGEATLPSAFRARAWDLIEKLIEAPDPTPADEATRGPGFQDAPSYSINTARGSAVRALIQYSLWIFRALKTETTRPTLTTHMPEARAALEELLDDPNPSVHSAYGELFPWLVLMDPAWASGRLDSIFPAASEKEPFRIAAWEGYMQLPIAYDEPFAIARREYLRAVNELDSADDASKTEESRHLAEHLTQLYWRGRISLEADDDRMLRIFFTKAPVWLRAHAIDHIGFALQKTEGEVTAAIQSRLTRLFEWRLEENAEPEELAEFARWYASGKLDQTWSTSMLLETLKRTSFGFHDHLVLETAAESTIPPAQKLQILQAIRARDPDRMAFHLWEEPTRAILGEAVGSPDATTRATALAIVDDLIHKGLHQFRDLYRA